MLFIGPNDLAGSIGKLERLGGDDVKEQIAVTEARIRASGKWMGTVPLPNVALSELAARGHRLIVGSGDIGLFMDGAAAAARTWDEELSGPAKLTAARDR